MKLLVRLRCALLLLACALARPASAQKAPEQSLATFQVAGGLQASLFASEPMLVNPTNIDVDAHGRVWACEAVNYRGWSKLRPEGDRIVVMEDTDGDGRADRHHTFYQGTDVNAALGICVLGNKVLVSCSPNLLVLTDTDGDLKADKKEVLFGGVGGKNDDHGLHAAVFGPDGRLYFNHGNAGGRVGRADGSKLVDRSGVEVRSGARHPASKSGPYRQGMVHRCDPDGANFEVLGWNFRNNYEAAVDSFGTVWQSDNDDDGNTGVRINYVMEFGNYGYTDEMTGAGWQSRRTNMELRPDGSLEKPRAHWHQNDPGVVPNLLGTGGGSPAGICIYEGDLLPPVFRSQIIHADAGPNVVRAYPVAKEGAGYTATVADIIRAGDKWFRPVDVCIAPDGSLIVADWYDSVVGGNNMQDSNADPSKMRGRIVRVTPAGLTAYRVPPLKLDTPAGAVEALCSPNLARRHLAFEALRTMGAAAEGELLGLWRSRDPRLRARALHLLARIEGRAAHYVALAIADADEDIRITGVRTARALRLDVLPVVEKLLADPSPAVRRELLIALRHSEHLRAAELWAALALRHDGRDRWYLEALGIAADRNEDRFLDAYLAAAKDRTSAAFKDVVWRSRGKRAPALLAAWILDPATTRPDRLRFLRALDFHAPAEREAAVLSLLDSDDPTVAAEALLRLKGSKDPRVAAALGKTLDAAAGTPRLVELVELLDVRDRDRQVLAIAVADPASQAAAAAVRVLLRNGTALIEKELAGRDAVPLAAALGTTADRKVIDLLAAIAADESRENKARRTALVALGRSKAGGLKMLELIRGRKLGDDLLDEAARHLHTSTSREVREAARQLLPLPPTKDGAPLPPMDKLMAMKGDVEGGRMVFATTCFQCHQINEEGTNFGPPLTEIGSKLGKDGLLVAILNPSAGIEHNYEGHLVRTRSGDEYVGLLHSETADEIQLRIAGGIVQPIPRSQIRSHRVLAESIMPQDLVGTLTVQELVDVVEYLQTRRKAK